MPKLGDVIAPRLELLEQVNAEGVINTVFPTGMCTDVAWLERMLGEATADAVLIPDWLGTNVLNATPTREISPGERKPGRPGAHTSYTKIGLTDQAAAFVAGRV
ncbi:MAG: hypothetical protein QOI01_1400 [Mycobacterium sp.]|jgi:hypothetical protein|nr:hypothetical protein [Mycobacterium sp.]